MPSPLWGPGGSHPGLSGGMVSFVLDPEYKGPQNILWASCPTLPAASGDIQECTTSFH